MNSVGTQTEPNDRTLDVDGLEEFLPQQRNSEDPTLAVSALHELFDEQPPPAPAIEIADQEPASDPTLDAGALEDYFREELRTVAAVSAAEGSWDADAEVPDHVEGLTDLQRGAMEFQRFAEGFRAFASECAQR